MNCASYQEKKGKKHNALIVHLPLCPLVIRSAGLMKKGLCRGFRLMVRQKPDLVFLLFSLGLLYLDNSDFTGKAFVGVILDHNLVVNIALGKV